jgi:hypothetical protein
MHEVTFTKDEILTLRRALNALVTRQELNLIPASESAKKRYGAQSLTFTKSTSNSSN